MFTILFAYVILVVFFAIIERLRKGQEAKMFSKGQFDKGSTLLISVALLFDVIVLIAANAFNNFHIGTVIDSIGWIGIAIMFCGVTLRVWALQTLGKFYTRTLRVTESHHVVQEGPYKKVRHPGYLGVILVLGGAGLATVNWIVAVIITLTIVAAYYYRINCEENMLVASFGDQYREYMEHTWKLVPFVY
jgi:protein-S-isoprenylcysteine O-methyltransferase Ste14